MTTPVKDRVKAHYQAQKKKGLVSLRVWVPKEWVEALKSYAKYLREGEAKQ